jgi:hypothetical protein
MNLAKVRRELHAQDPRCYWCKRVTVLKQFTGRWEELDATVDHIQSKLETDDPAVYNSAENVVLSCFRCNQQRAAATYENFLNAPGVLTIHPAKYFGRVAQKNREKAVKWSKRPETIAAKSPLTLSVEPILMKQLSELEADNPDFHP